MKVREYIKNHTEIELNDITTNSGIVTVIEVPHQRPATTLTYLDNEEYLTRYIGSIEETDGGGEIEGAMEWLETKDRVQACEEVARADLHSWRKLVGTDEILDFEPTAHQQHKVLAQIAADITTWLI